MDDFRAADPPIVPSRPIAFFWRRGSAGKSLDGLLGYFGVADPLVSSFADIGVILVSRALWSAPVHTFGLSGVANPVVLPLCRLLDDVGIGDPLVN